jgi:hypothetical protein
MSDYLALAQYLNIPVVSSILYLVDVLSVEITRGSYSNYSLVYVYPELLIKNVVIRIS